MRRERLGLVGALCLLPTVAAADPRAESLDIPRHRISAGLGAAPGMTFDVGYAYRPPLPLGRTHLVGRTSFGFPIPGVADGRSFDASLGANWIVPPVKWLGVVTSAGVVVRSASTPMGDAVGWGLELEARPGWLHERAYVCALLGWQPMLGTHVRHRQPAVDAFADRYPDQPTTADDRPRDGWYLAPAHRIRLGVDAGITIRRRVTPYLAGGFEVQPGRLGVVRFPDVGILPFFVDGGLAVHL